MPFHPIRGFPWKICALTSLTASAFLTFFAPQYIIGSSFRTFVCLFFIQISITSTYQVILYPKLLSPLRKLPRPSGGSFFNGFLYTINREAPGMPMLRWNNEVPNDGLMYYTYLFNAERVLVTSPKALAEVLVQKNYEFIKPRMFRVGLGQLLGFGVLLAEGEEHKVQRKNLMPAFAYRHVKDLYPVFWGKSCELAKVLAMNSCPQGSESVTHVKNAPVVEFGGWANRATLDIIGVAGMGHDFNAIQDPDNELNRTYRSLFHSSGEAQLLRFLSLLLPSWFLRALPVERNNQLFQGARTIRRVCRQLIDSKKEKLGQTEKPAGVDILSVALGSGGFTEENLVDQMMTFLAAGHETTATAMIWAVYEICLNPGIQSRLRKEIRTNLPPLDDSEASVTAPMFDRLPFLHAVCNEVLRVHAPVPITVREADHDATIQGQFVPAGTRVIIPVWAVNMSKSLWGDDATKFCPDRWMGEGKTNTGGASNNYSFLTFLHGPRSCIGQAFAKAEFACLLAALVGRFEMVLEDPDRVIEIQGGITSKPKEGLPIRMKALDGW